MLFLNAHGRPASIDHGAISAAIDTFHADALLWGEASGMTARISDKIRQDSADGKLSGTVVPEWQVIRQASLHSIGTGAANSLRADAYSATGGGLAPDRTRAYVGRLMSEPLPPLNSFTAFGQRTDVPVGAREFQVERSIHIGQAGIIAGGGDSLPQVGYQINFERFPVRHIGCVIDSNILEAPTAALAGVDDRGIKLRAANRVIAELWNKINYGLAGTAAGLVGINNYPLMPRTTSALTWTRAAAAAAPSSYYEELNAAFKYAEEASDEALSPNAVQFSTKIWNILHETRLYTSGDSSETIMQALQKANPEITSWTRARELNDISANVDGIYVYQSGQDGTEVVTVQPPTILPTERTGLVNRTIVYATVGGVTMGQAGACQMISCPTA